MTSFPCRRRGDLRFLEAADLDVDLLARALAPDVELSAFAGRHAGDDGRQFAWTG